MPRFQTLVGSSGLATTAPTSTGTPMASTARWMSGVRPGVGERVDVGRVLRPDHDVGLGLPPGRDVGGEPLGRLDVVVQHGRPLAEGVQRRPAGTLPWTTAAVGRPVARRLGSGGGRSGAPAATDHRGHDAAAAAIARGRRRRQHRGRGQQRPGQRDRERDSGHAAERGVRPLNGAVGLREGQPTPGNPPNGTIARAASCGHPEHAATTAASQRRPLGERRRPTQREPQRASGARAAPTRRRR